MMTKFDSVYSSGTLFLSLLAGLSGKSTNRNCPKGVTNVRTYEMMFIIDAASLEGAAVQQAATGISNLVGQVGGQILNMRRMGLRQLAFPINKKTDGYYFLAYFSLESSLITELNRRLRLNDSLLRYMITCPLPTTSLDFDDDEEEIESNKVSDEDESEESGADESDEEEIDESDQYDED